MQWIECPDRDALTEVVSRRVSEQLVQSLAERPTAGMVLSGGGTPMPIYRRLAGMELDWSQVTAVPSDERWVPIDHAASNTGQIRGLFNETGLKVESLVPDDAPDGADPRHAEAILASLPAPFDLVMLGMGGDAHFASLFPRSPALETGLDPTSTVDALTLTPDPLPPEAPFARVSLSLARLLKTRALLLVISGEGKREVLMQAARPDADAEQMPVAALLRAAGDALEIFWSP